MEERTDRRSQDQELGFFSVVASVLSTILSMTLGFPWVFAIALLIYTVGVIALSRTPEPSSIAES